MGVLQWSPLTSVSLSVSVSTMVITASPVSRFPVKPNDVPLRYFNGVRIHVPFDVKQRGGVIVKASSDIDGVSPGGDEGPPEEGEEEGEEVVPVENLPLESKLQLKLEQKLRMKMAKKIRLRRKKLVRKRRMRKKGRWPPSKMKKNKNV